VAHISATGRSCLFAQRVCCSRRLPHAERWKATGGVAVQKLRSIGADLRGDRGPQVSTFAVLPSSLSTASKGGMPLSIFMVGLFSGMTRRPAVRCVKWGARRRTRRAVSSIFSGRDPHDMDRVADHIGGALLAFGASGHQLIPLNSTSINRVFGYFLRKARRASLRPAENPPSSASGSSLKNEAISPPLSSKMRTDIRTSDPLLPMKIPNALLAHTPLQHIPAAPHPLRARPATVHAGRMLRPSCGLTAGRVMVMAGILFVRLTPFHRTNVSSPKQAGEGRNGVLSFTLAR
jgi:hypothetical protein